MKKLTIIMLIALSFKTYGQGYNHQWLLGYFYFIQDPKGRLLFDSSSYTLVNETRKMVFMGTEANISDSNGNLLMSSNGVWIADATGDTMQNGSGLNPWGVTSSWPYGLPMMNNNLLLPLPNDTFEYILFHHTATQLNSIHKCFELCYSLIDINQNSGLGQVISKNNLIISDTLMGGIGSCKHANGKDWWIFMMKDSSDIIYKIALTDSSQMSITSQKMNFSPLAVSNVAQLTFSPSGNKFVATTYDNPINRNSYVVISDFDRCTGMFSNTQTVQVTSGAYIWGTAFSPSGKYIYACSSQYVFQIDAATHTVDTIATYDGFISPVGATCCPTTFWNMYLAANGKIYITSGSGVQHLHEITYPDSAGTACKLQQHIINLGFGNLRAVPNRPNYYLGCDTTFGCTPCYTGINEIKQHDFKFSISPNPSNGSFKIIYLLPQNKSGTLQIFDITGKEIYKQNLPPWSTMQYISLPKLANGVYNCTIISNNERVHKKLVVLNM